MLGCDSHGFQLLIENLQVGEIEIVFKRLNRSSVILTVHLYKLLRYRLYKTQYMALHSHYPAIGQLPHQILMEFQLSYLPKGSITDCREPAFHVLYNRSDP